MALLRAGVLLALGAVVAACATGTDEPGGGGENLPSAGVVPLELPEEPLLLALEDGDLGAPWGLEEPGGGLRVWFTVDDGAQRIGVATGVRTDGQWKLTLDDASAFEAEADWEGGSVSQPSVLRRGEDLWLAYVTGTGTIGVATGLQGAPVRGDGPAWSDGGSALSSPSLVDGPEGVLLFAVDAAGALRVASREQGTLFEEIDADLLPPPDDPEAKATISSASVVAATTAGGRVLYRCHFETGGKVGFAAAFDDLAFSRFAIHPILEDSGFAIAAPMAVGDVVLHARNRVQSKPGEGRGIGAARLRPR